MTLPEPGHYATGILFLEKDELKATAAEKMFTQLAAELELNVSALYGTLYCDNSNIILDSKLTSLQS